MPITHGASLAINSCSFARATFGRTSSGLPLSPTPWTAKPLPFAPMAHSVVATIRWVRETTPKRASRRAGAARANVCGPINIDRSTRRLDRSAVCAAGLNKHWHRNQATQTCTPFTRRLQSDGSATRPLAEGRRHTLCYHRQLLSRFVGRNRRTRF